MCPAVFREKRQCLSDREPQKWENLSKNPSLKKKEAKKKGRKEGKEEGGMIPNKTSKSISFICILSSSVIEQTGCFSQPDASSCECYILAVRSDYPLWGVEGVQLLMTAEQAAPCQCDNWSGERRTTNHHGNQRNKASSHDLSSLDWKAQPAADWEKESGGKRRNPRCTLRLVYIFRIQRGLLKSWTPRKGKTVVALVHTQICTNFTLKRPATMTIATFKNW